MTACREMWFWSFSCRYSLRGLPVEGEVRTPLIVLPLPLPEEPHAVLDRDEPVDAIELLIVGPVAPLHFPVLFRGTDPRLPVADAQVLEVPAEGLGRTRTRCPSGPV